MNGTGVNTIRVYTTEPSGGRDGYMQASNAKAYAPGSTSLHHFTLLGGQILRIQWSSFGPYIGTVDAPPANPGPPSSPRLANVPSPAPEPPNTVGGYAADASAESDSDHFAVWERAAAVDKGLIQDVVAANEAFLMLVMLGFNDMGWYSDLLQLSLIQR